jgi:hypothetical protein
VIKPERNGAVLESIIASRQDREIFLILYSISLFSFLCELFVTPVTENNTANAYHLLNHPLCSYLNNEVNIILFFTTDA